MADINNTKKEALRLQSCLGSGLPVGSVLHCSIRGASHNLDSTIMSGLKKDVPSDLHSDKKIIAQKDR